MKKLLTFLLCAVPIAAQVSLPNPQSRVAGRFVAFNYGGWRIPVYSAPVGTGSHTFSVPYSSVQLVDGRTVMPFNTNSPIFVGTEEVTPSAVGPGCTLGNTVPGACVLTATFSNPHTNADFISSATYGLQEALNDAGASGGGAVTVDSAWANAGGTTDIINAATLPTHTAIEDVRTGTGGGGGGISGTANNFQLVGGVGTNTIGPITDGTAIWQWGQDYSIDLDCYNDSSCGMEFSDGSGDTSFFFGGMMALDYNSTNTYIQATPAAGGFDVNSQSTSSYTQLTTTSLNIGGSSSGQATIGVAAAAGSPNPLFLPTTTAPVGGIPYSDGGSPDQQLGWTAFQYDPTGTLCGGDLSGIPCLQSTSVGNGTINMGYTELSLVNLGNGTLPTVNLLPSSIEFYPQVGSNYDAIYGYSRAILYDSASNYGELKPTEFSANSGTTSAYSDCDDTGTCTLGGSASGQATIGVTATGGTLIAGAGGIETGTSSNTDLTGIMTASGGTATYTFSGTYTSAPVCVAIDDTTIASLLTKTVSTTVLTVTTTGATDSVSYICHGRN